MKTLLCATDLSPASQPAIAAAAALARGLRARLELLHVVHIPPGLPPELLSAELVEDMMAAAKSTLDAKRAEIAAQGIEVVTTLAMGQVDDRILGRAREIEAELLILGTHARHGVARAMVGSVAERAIRHAICPTLVIPPSGKDNLAAWTPAARPLKILAAVDLSPASESLLAWLRRLVGQTRCELRFLHTYWPPREHERLGLDPPDPFEPDPAAVEVLARDIRREIATWYGNGEVALQVRPFWGGDDNPFLWEADTDDVDLLVLGASHEHRGSTAVGTVRDAMLPVLCVPSRPASAAAARAKALPPVRHVLCTTDFSPLGNAAVAEAYRLLARVGGTVVLGHVAAPVTFGLSPERRSELETCLLGLVPDGVDQHRIHTSTFIAESSNPGEAIVQAVRRLGPDVVVMSSHGRSALAHVIRGSVTEHVLRGSPKPVLVVPSPEHAAP